MIYKKKKRFDIGRCLLHRYSSFSPLLGEEDYLTSPKNVCVGGYSRSSNRSLFINHHSDLKMVTSPVKLCCLLPTPLPPHYDPDFRFQPRRRHEVLKRGRQVCIPPLPAPTGTNVLHFDMNFCSPPMPLAPLSGLPL